MILFKAHGGAKHGAKTNNLSRVVDVLGECSEFEGYTLSVPKIQAKIKGLLDDFSSKYLNPNANLSGEDGEMDENSKMAKHILQEEEESARAKKEISEKKAEDQAVMGA